MVASAELRAQLLRAIDAQDVEAFDRALINAFGAGLLRDLSDILSDALLMSWHRNHEDLALALQATKDHRAVEALFRAALSQHEYLEYDEFCGLARKCTWALADIATDAAKERLQALARSENHVIAGYAQRRLDLWQDEMPRKGH